MKKIIDEFIFETTLIDPIEKIICGLRNKEYRDCDIAYLNEKLYKYTNFATSTLGIKFNNTEIVENDGILNDYKIKRFLKSFEIILNYFKGL